MRRFARLQHPADVSSGSLAYALARCGDQRTRVLANDLNAANASLARHGADVAAVAVALARELGVGDERLEPLCRAALLHDIGKRYVPRSVLDKPGPLVADERQLVEAHPALGANILARAGLLSEALIVRHHHERWDGTGYPHRLRGEAIPLESRIVLVADALDAMTSDRPYRAAMPLATALSEIRRSAGSQLDPRCVEALDAIGALRAVA
jgi:putative nucleotidyltransferase with HDIG domain